jgi:ribosomal protein S20
MKNTVSAFRNITAQEKKQEREKSQYSVILEIIKIYMKCFKSRSEEAYIV